MKLALVGVGDAGARIVDRVVRYGYAINQEFSVGNVLTINTDQSVFEELEHVPSDRQVLIGELHPDVDGEGVDGDVDLAVEVAREDLDEIRRAFDEFSMYELDGVLVVAGLAGGTGSGLGAVLFEELQNLFEDPVYGLGILPHENEGKEAALTAARSLLTIVPLADNLIVFDNESWFSSENTREENFDRANDELATRLVRLLGAGEHDDPIIPETCLDPSDLMITLGTGGISTIGYAETTTQYNRGLIAYLRAVLGLSDGDSPPNAVRIKELVQRAVTSKLTLSCNVSSADRIVIIITGPPEALSRKGFENARHWLEQKTDTVEIRAGDEPRKDSSTLSVVVLFSNVTDVPRIESMQETAVSAHRENATKAFGWNEASDS